jgi:O-antigen ligase
LLIFAMVLFLFGGSSRYDQLAQIPVRLAALLLIGWASFRSARAAPTALRIPAILLGAAIALVTLQLLPLPPAVWTLLPGRSAFAELAGKAGFDQPWRPLAIAPDLAVNALLALSVPAAVLYGLATLNPRHWRWLYPAILTVILLSLVVGLVQLAIGSGGFTAIYRIQWKETASGIFANRNHQALLLAIGLPLLAGWDEIRRNGTRGTIARSGACVVTLLLVLALIATGSRAGALLGLFGLFGALSVSWNWFSGRTKTETRRRWVAAFAVVAALVMLVGLSMFFGRGEALDRLFSADPLGDKRARAFPTVIAALTTYFPAGTGFGGFDDAFRLAEPFGLLETTYFNQAHNDIVQVVLEGGAPGLILMGATFGWLGLVTWRVWRAPGTRSAIVRARAATIALLLTIVASLVDYPLRTPIMLAITAALVFQIAIALDDVRSASRAPG